MNTCTDRLLNGPRGALRAFRSLWLIAALILCGAPTLANADPPQRVARIAAPAGPVSFAPEGASEWRAAVENQPLAIGDRLWVGEAGRLELQTGDAVARLGAETLAGMTGFADNAVQLQLSQGTIRYRIRRLSIGDMNEIATPDLVFVMAEPGDYRLDVNPSDATTLVAVRSGRAEVHSDGRAYTIYAGRAYRFRGTGLREHEEIGLPPADSLDLWAADREIRFSRAVSASYVAPGVIGAEDLDPWGDWRQEPELGAVWYPRAVAPDWTPFSTGQWLWVAPWGWTWIDAAPWGFAVSHYGRWTQVSGRWGWVPGPLRTRPVYAPALVGFIGGPGFQLTLSSGPTRAIGWYPLGPREVYRPWYPVSQVYFGRVNIANTPIPLQDVQRHYDRRNGEHDTHVHRRNPAAIVAVPAGAFTRPEPVGRARLPLTERDLGGERAARPLDALPPRPSGIAERSERGAIAPPPERPTIQRPIPAARPQPGTIDTRPDGRPSPRLQPEPDRPRFESAPGVQPVPAPRPMTQEQRGIPEQRGMPAAQPMPQPVLPSPVRPSTEFPSPTGPRTQPEVRPAPVMREAPVPHPSPMMRESPSTPVIREAPVPRPAPVLREAPMSQPAPVMREAPSPRHSPEIRPPAELRPAPMPRPAPEMRRAPEPAGAGDNRGQREQRGGNQGRRD